MKKQIFALAAATLIGSTAFASTLSCWVVESTPEHQAVHSVLVEDGATEFVQAERETTKGFITYSEDHVVINFYDTHDHKPTYLVTPIHEDGIAMVFTPEYDPSYALHVKCGLQ